MRSTSNMNLSITIALFVVLCLLRSINSADIKLTNLECEEHDKPFATIPVCRLKLVQRNVVAMDLHVKLNQLPVNNVTVNNQLLKKANGYRPFLYNITENFCDIMKNLKRYPYMNVYMNFLIHYSNINHTCPFDHDIIVKRLVLKDEMFKLMPLPGGNYLVAMKIYAYNDLKATIKVYVNVH